MKLTRAFVNDQVMSTRFRNSTWGSIAAKGFRDVCVGDFGVGILAEVEYPDSLLVLEEK